MSTPSGSGSRLAGLAARRQSLQKARERLSLAPSGGAAGQRPQSNVQAPAPLPQAPASPPIASGQAGAPAPLDAAGTVRDPEMLQQAQAFIDQAKNEGKTSVAPPTGVVTAPPSVPVSLNDQIANVGAQGMSPYAQAMRVYGRPPAAREMAIFSAVQTLEAQLGRPPTRNEVMMFVTAPGGQNTTGPEPVI